MDLQLNVTTGFFWNCSGAVVAHAVPPSSFPFGPDELLHSLTLGALLRYGCSGGVPLRGGGPHMLDLLRDDLKLTPLPVEPRAAFPAQPFTWPPDRTPTQGFFEAVVTVS